MIFIAFGRDHTFKDLQSVQAELNQFMRQLTPQKSARGSAAVPYLTASGDANLGQRVEICRGVSEFSGAWVVEEVSDPASPQFVLRRLIFLSNQGLVQSEARRCCESESSNSPSIVPARFDFSHLSCGYYGAFVSGLMWSDAVQAAAAKSAPESSDLHGALIGLGGGLFPMYLHEALPCLRLHCVELDIAVVDIARNHFGFSAKSDRMTVEVCDGLEWVAARSSRVSANSDIACSSQSSSAAALDAPVPPANPIQPSLHFLFIDVDSKNESSGLACPPAAFVEQSFLQHVHSILLPRGLLLLNLVCRAKDLFQSIVALARSVFASVHLLSIPDDVNVCLICIAHDASRAATDDAEDASAADEDSPAIGGTMSLTQRIEAFRSLLHPKFRDSVDLAALAAATQIDSGQTQSAAKKKRRNKKKK